MIIFAATVSRRKANWVGSSGRVAHVPASAAAEFSRLKTTEMAAVRRVAAHRSHSTSGARKMPPPTPVTPDISLIIPPRKSDLINGGADGAASSSALVARAVRAIL